MNKIPCPQLPRVRLALRSGDWPPQLRRHADTCEDCREEVRVQAWLGRLAAALPDEPAPVAPQMIWLRARLAEKRDAGRRALRPLFILQTTLQVFFTVALMLLMIWQQAEIESWLKSLGEGMSGWSEGMMLAGFVCAGTVLIGAGLVAAFGSLAYRR